MGFISRKIFPACGNMCVCCPALRSRSRQPVKRYKKLLADIFPKSPDGSPSERKIIKLCEYAAKNPLRIPKIAKHLEDRCSKELQSQHIRFINIVVEVYEKLLYMCKEQMAYFAVSLLNMTSELLENSKQDSMRILGCQTLTKFIYSQADGTYAHSIENYVIKVCKLACQNGEEHQKHCLRASSLQCLSAMVWYMAEFSYIFAAFDEMVHAILDNYEPKTPREGAAEGGDPHHNWLNEVVRCEGRGSVIGETNPSCLITRPFSEKKDPKLLTREEIETPRIWAQICIQRMADLAKESTTMRLILDPVFVYFDSGRHWVPRQGLATMVLSDMCYFMETLGSQQLILAALIRHLDHKNVARDLQLKSYIIQVAAILTKQIRIGGLLKDGGFVSDLCWHLRKSLQATVESVGEQEANLNLSLQNSIELCLHEIAKGIGDAVPLFDVMAITLENLPSSGVIARATIGSLMILAHIISLLWDSTHSQQAFPEALLIQLLKAMLHPDVEARIGAHGIFSVLLIPSSNRFRPELASLEPGYLIETRRRRSNTASTFASITALLEKLRKEKDGAKVDNSRDDVFDIKERDIPEEDWKHGCAHKKDSPNLYKISSIIDKTTGSTGMTEAEPFITKLSEDDLEKLLSGFWMQANLPDNLPSNFEAIAHSFVLTCVSSRFTNPNANLVVRFFQLPVSLMNMSMDTTNETLSPACQRSILVLSMAMLMFTAKIYHMNDLLETLLPLDVDPYLGISDDFQLYIKSQADVNVYGSATDILSANSVLSELRSKIYEETAKVVKVLVQNLSIISELEADDLARQLAEPFTPDDTFIFSQGSILDLDIIQMVSHSKESLSFDKDIPNGSLVEDDAISEESVADVLRFIAKTPSSPSGSHIISIGQLMESALAVAGRVAATSVSTSPLSYDTMASQCETLGNGSRKKLSHWLAHENPYGQVADTVSPAFLYGHSGRKVGVDAGDFNGSIKPMESSLSIRLPPASPFDNFLKAAGCQKEDKTIFSHY